MISARHLVPGRVLLAPCHLRIIDDRSPLGFYDDWEHVHCVVVGLTQAGRPTRARKKAQGPSPGPEGWSVLVIWLDSRCEPHIQTVHASVNNDWELAW